ncbi:MAG TPA: cytochrome c [Hyphomicrobiaceae bacterium]|nr:cytochrome c [Hyphomicrobiaceae bacterium]
MDSIEASIELADHLGDVAGALALSLSTAPLGAQSALPADGAELARKLCSNCHGTDPDGGAPGRPDVPSFRVIANRSQTTPERLASAIILPHPEMPGIGLTRAETRAIIDYIMSLKK